MATDAYTFILTSTEITVQFNHSVMFDSLWPHELQHARPPCLSPIPGVHSNSCASSWWCHPAISSSVIPFSSSPQSLPASGSFPMSQLFAWGDQIIGVCGDTQKNMLLTLKKTTLGMNKLNKQMILSSFWEIGNEQECLCKLNRMEKSWFYRR